VRAQYFQTIAGATRDRTPLGVCPAISTHLLSTTIRQRNVGASFFYFIIFIARCELPRLGSGGGTRPFPRDEAWRNSTEIQQSGHAPRSGPYVYFFGHFSNIVRIFSTMSEKIQAISDKVS